MKLRFLPRLDDIKSNTNRKNEDQIYITRKQNEFLNLYDISEEKRRNPLEAPEYISASPTKKPRNNTVSQIS